MLKTRVIPCLLLRGDGLVKTLRFREPRYIGDPINTIKIFNEKEVDELILLDILATIERKSPRFGLISKVASECFMPLCYGGGIRDLSDIEEIFSLGVEKISINSYAVENPSFVAEAAKVFGSQSIVVTLDVKKNSLGAYEVFTHGASRPTGKDPVSLAKQMEDQGAGELMINSIDRDGTMQGYDLELVRAVADSVKIPVVALGGAGKIEDFADAVKKGGASAVAAGSIFVFLGKHRAVLVNYPPRVQLEGLLRPDVGAFQ